MALALCFIFLAKDCIMHLFTQMYTHVPTHTYTGTITWPRDKFTKTFVSANTAVWSAYFSNETEVNVKPKDYLIWVNYNYIHIHI